MDSKIHVAPDLVNAAAWRVEYFDADGGCYVTIFAGPEAEQRARDYGAALTDGRLKRIEAPVLS